MIPEQLTRNRPAYSAALADSDSAWAQSILDVTQLEGLLQHCLEEQLKFLG